MANFGYDKIVSTLRNNYREGNLYEYGKRLEQLQALYRLVEENEGELLEALHKDLGKCKTEGRIMETMIVMRECGETIQYLKTWMKPESVKPDLLNSLYACKIIREPLGVVLIMGAWNYPVQLTLLPLIGALAAGNCAILKPSELSPHSAQVMTKLVQKYMDPDFVRIVNGAIPETTELLKQRFDKIFFTGSPSVGKIIMKAASEYLTPVDLELGGKCPAIVDESCNFDAIGNRIAWAKLANAGQTCLAVDYIICVGNCRDKLIESLKKSIESFYGEDQQESDSYGRILNKRHVARLQKLIDPSKVVYGNKVDEDDLYISPTIMKDVSPDDPVMQDEIFGPILPVLTVKNIDEAIRYVQEREKPLALYIFSNVQKTIDRILKMTSSGSVCVNDAVVQGAVPTLPFGGVGNSGMGAYHGHFSYDAFSHRKACIIKDQRLEFLNK
ncbi:aldehyde dehydrogenase, dimeric NADP-preferring-like [Clytia hemisphaerica]